MAHSTRPPSNEAYSTPTTGPKQLSLHRSTASRATPGPNAFALKQHADSTAMEQQRLRGNAFYQQEAARRNATPMGLHPALRPLAQEETSSPLDALSKYATDRFENERASQVTTMTPFLNSGTERVTVTAPHHSSPELKLVPHGREEALPTTRGFIEEQREHTAWNASGRADERTPVFQYTPKPPSGFESESGTRRQSTEPGRPPSPRKKFMDRFHIPSFNSTQRMAHTSRNSTSTPTSAGPVPPKAAAVLGTGASPSKNALMLSRSPSKKEKEAAARRKVDSTGSITSVISLTPSETQQQYVFHNNRIYPKLLIPDATPNHNSNIASIPAASTITNSTHHLRPARSKRILSDTHTPSPTKDTTHQIPARSKTIHHHTHSSPVFVAETGLEYIDRAPPPTPPTKDTPPEIKAYLSATPGTGHRRNHTVAETPSRLRVPFSGPIGGDDEEGMGFTVTHAASDGEQWSPTKTGGYAYKDRPNVVKMASHRSLHAAVFETPTKRERGREKEGETGLSAEGFLPRAYYSALKEGKRDVSREAREVGEGVYSPSLYEGESVGGVKDEAPASSQSHYTYNLPFTTSHRSRSSKSTTSTKASIPMVFQPSPDHTVSNSGQITYQNRNRHGKVTSSPCSVEVGPPSPQPISPQPSQPSPKKVTFDPNLIPALTPKRSLRRSVASGDLRFSVSEVGVGGYEALLDYSNRFSDPRPAYQRHEISFEEFAAQSAVPSPLKVVGGGFDFRKAEQMASHKGQEKSRQHGQMSEEIKTPESTTFGSNNSMMSETATAIAMVDAVGKMEKIGVAMENLQKGQVELNKWMGKVMNKLDGLEKRLDAVEGRMDKHLGQDDKATVDMETDLAKLNMGGAIRESGGGGGCGGSGYALGDAGPGIGGSSRASGAGGGERGNTSSGGAGGAGELRGGGLWGGGAHSRLSQGSRR